MYKLQLHQKVQQNDLPRHYDSVANIPSWIDNDTDYISRVCFGGEATFHILDNVYHHNCHIWGTQNPQDVREHERDSLKLNVCCRLTNAEVSGPFFFHGRTVTGAVYFDMLENYAVP
jgi:hypothetical protein